MRKARFNLSFLTDQVGMKRWAWSSTIRARLYLAFGLAAALTIGSSLIAFYEFVAIGATTNEIVSRTLPSTVISLRLAEEATSLVASAPILMTAEDDKTRSDTAERINRQAKSLADGIGRLSALGVANTSDIDAARDALLLRLTTLNQAVIDRIVISEERRALASSIRMAHEALLDGLIPAIDDANFDLMTKSRRTGIDVTLNATLDSSRRLMEAESQSNLLAGLLTEASLVIDATRLPPLRDLIGAAKRKIETNLTAINDTALQEKLTSLYNKFAIIGGDDGIIGLRTYELNRQHDAQVAFAAAQFEAVKLKQSVDGLVEQQGLNASANSTRAASQIRSGQILLIVLAIVAIVGAGMVAWLYVGRNIARRLGLLSNAMRRIADGDLDVEVHDHRGDEIANMARTLMFFRQATADAKQAQQNEIEQARTSEVRRTSMEAATKGFEHAVSNIVRTLDHASDAMNTSAQAMAESASRNEEQALRTAAASEEATTNVESVACAADEMARTVEHISSRVSDSTIVARQAATEAEEITGAVEGLSASVGQIGEISSLIRSIASQTNLLALNATIEAARAGEAGRGFAVVAQEVKSLAAQTGKATEGITRQIQSIEETTSRSVNTMKTIASTIVRLNQLAEDIAVSMRQQGSVTQEIALNAGAAANGTRDVSASISEVSNIAVKTGQVAHTVLGAAGDLAQQSNLLRKEVEAFLAQVRVA